MPRHVTVDDVSYQLEDTREELRVARDLALRMADHCIELADTLDAFYWRCRCCHGRSPQAGIDTEARADQIRHAYECPVRQARAYKEGLS